MKYILLTIFCFFHVYSKVVLFTYYTYINACFFLDSFPLCNYKTLNIHIAVYEIDEQEGPII